MGREIKRDARFSLNTAKLIMLRYAAGFHKARIIKRDSMKFREKVKKDMEGASCNV